TVHYLLTGDVSLEERQVPPPLGNVVLGGTPVKFLDASYGSVRSLTPEEVQAVASALREIPTEEMSRRFDAAARAAPEIYSQSWDDEDREALLEYYPRLVRFFEKAAEAGKVVLLDIE